MIYFPQPPSDSPPSGGDQNEAPLLRAIIGTELGVCTLVIAARLYTRLRLVRNAGIDDWIMFATYVDFQQRNQSSEWQNTDISVRYLRPSDPRWIS
jgi:hypothetical protein